MATDKLRRVNRHDDSEYRVDSIVDDDEPMVQQVHGPRSKKTVEKMVKRAHNASNNLEDAPNIEMKSIQRVETPLEEPTDAASQTEDDDVN